MLIDTFTALLASAAISVAQPNVRTPTTKTSATMPVTHCATAPRDGWISWLEVQDRLKEQGMRLVQLRIGDDRCYAITALDGHGEYMTMLMHPVSGKIVSSASGIVHPRATVPWKFGRKYEDD